MRKNILNVWKIILSFYVSLNDTKDFSGEMVLFLLGIMGDGIFGELNLWIFDIIIVGLHCYLFLFFFGFEKGICCDQGAT